MPSFWRKILRSPDDKLLFPFSGKADTAVILGSGLSALVSRIDPVRSVKLEDISGFRPTSVEGHPGRMLLAREGGSEILIFSGRTHLYELGSGFDHHSTASIRLASLLGCRNLLLTQAAGSLSRDLEIGSWLLAEDIVSVPQAALMREAAFDSGGSGGLPRGSIGSLISDSFRRRVAASALRAGVEVSGGTLFWTTGPCFETPAEARMARYMGADAATMSPLPELLEARRLGLAAACLSRISNFAPNVEGRGSIKHGEIVDKGKEAASGLLAVIRGLPGRRRVDR